MDSKNLENALPHSKQRKESLTSSRKRMEPSRSESMVESRNKRKENLPPAPSNSGSEDDPTTEDGGNNESRFLTNK